MANTLNVGNGDWATKENSLLGYNSENGNYKPLPFDFTRASNGTFVNKSGLIETAANGVPRIDFSNDAKGALLLEPQRSNLMTYSSDYTDASWTKSNNPTITSNIAIAPDGTQTANGIQDTDGLNLKAIFQSSSVNSNSDVTISIFVKKELTNTNFGGLMLYFSGGTTKYVYGIIDEVNGVINIAPQSVIGSSSTKVEDYGTYWRFSLSGTDNGSNNTARFQYYASFSTNGTDVTGNAIGSLRTLWGAQLEQGSYATSLINTQGSAVTRLADDCNQTPPDGIIGQTEGTMFLNGDIQKFNNGSFYIAISNGNTLNSAIYMYQPSSGSLTIINRNLGTDTPLTVATANWSVGFNKVAIVYTTTSLKVFINGVIKGSISFSGLTPFTKFTLGKRPDAGTLIPKVEYKEVKLFNNALTDSEAIALTS